MNSLDTYEFAIIFLLGEKDFGKCAFTDFVQDIEVGKIDIDLAFDEVLFVREDYLQLERQVDFRAGNGLCLLVLCDDKWQVFGKERVEIEVAFFGDDIDG